MSKHHRTAGADYHEIPIGDKTYRMRPITIGDYAAMEAYIASQRPDPLAVASEAIKSLPSAQHDAIWKAAMERAVANRIVTSAEAKAFEDSVDGLAWKMWHCLKKEHPEIDSIEAARNLLIEAGEAHFELLARATEVASGEAELGKSSGQAVGGQEAVPAGQ